MKELFKYLRISRIFEFPGSSDELMERVEFLSNNHKRFRTTELGDKNYKISAKFSLGTLYMSGGLGVPINVLMNIKTDESANPTIHVTSKVRVEQYIFIALFSFIFTITLLSNEPWYLPLFIIGLFFVFHFWFHLVYRVQENELINKLKGQLKLQERKVRI
ncbi:MAG: hypothetical protein RIA69_15580 [Cyclobacteriaceae bacterium]